MSDIVNCDERLDGHQHKGTTKEHPPSRPGPQVEPDKPKSTYCRQCDAIAYSPAGGFCRTCPNGTKPSETQGSCIPCPPGQAGDGGICTECLAGEEPDPLRRRCIPCTAPGAYSRDGWNCSSCEPGSEPNRERTACNICQPGDFSSNGTRCGRCGYGQEPDIVEFGKGATACVTCMGGSSAEGADCERCSPGSGPDPGVWVNATILANGTQVPGRYENSSGCVPCGEGKVSANGEDCRPCAPGFGPTADHVRCLPCLSSYR